MNSRVTETVALLFINPDEINVLQLGNLMAQNTRKRLLDIENPQQTKESIVFHPAGIFKKQNHIFIHKRNQLQLAITEDKSNYRRS